MVISLILMHFRISVSVVLKPILPRKGILLIQLVRISFKRVKEHARVILQLFKLLSRYDGVRPQARSTSVKAARAFSPQREVVRLYHICPAFFTAASHFISPISFMTSAAIISPAIAGAYAIEPGTCLFPSGIIFPETAGLMGFSGE